MQKFLKIILIGMLVCAMFWAGILIADKQYLRNELIRIHVVANSDSTTDQNAKLAVKDAINLHLSKCLNGQIAIEDAITAIECQLPKIKNVAQQTLKRLNITDSVEITLTEEEFPVRKYDTFTLPSGIYRSLRVEIGDGKGQNWWCVAFPTLCMPTATEDFKCVAANAGIDSELSSTLTADDGYEIRFFLLDLLGKLENIFS